MHTNVTDTEQLTKHRFIFGTDHLMYFLCYYYNVQFSFCHEFNVILVPESGDIFIATIKPI